MALREILLNQELFEPFCGEFVAADSQLNVHAHEIEARPPIRPPSD
jgi:hypothetical protein